MKNYKNISAKERNITLKNDPDYRKYLFKGLLKHISQGYSLDCYQPLSEKSIRECIKDYPEEFCGEELEDAIRAAKTHWEGIGYAQATGACLGNSRSWYYNMAQRYGWSDKLQVDANIKGGLQVEVVSYASVKPTQEQSGKS